MDWNRKRHPEDVPTPVAVAVSDFCRRARAPASPGQVRDALALLSDEHDVQVRAMTDGEPGARLGPFALVDVILGTKAAVAAEREQSGYYEEGRRTAARTAREQPTPTLPVLAQESPRAARPSAAPSAPRPKKPRGPTLKERIGPQKRPVVAPVAARVAPPLPGTAFLPKRSLPLPRGRFTNVDPTRANFQSLFRPEGKEVVQGLIEQVPHRVALLKALEQGYVSKRGEALSVGDVEDLLEVHHLFEAIEGKEREGVLTAMIDQKGALSRASHAFGLTPEELERLITALGVEREVDEVRTRFGREALSEDNLSLRLDLLFRGRYLEDLGIEKKFATSLTRQLTALIAEVKDAATSVPTLVDLLSRQHALHAESLQRALEKLGLLEPWLNPKR